MKTLYLFPLIILLGISSCFKKKFEPPKSDSIFDPKLNVTHQIKDIIDFPQNKITEDIVISGIIIMNDEHGNIFKKLIIQDETAGIEILLDQTNIFTDFPLGRKVYIKLKDLHLGNFNEVIQIGFTPDEEGNLSSIPFQLINEHIVRADFPSPIIPDTLTIADLENPDSAHLRINTLVALKEIEFEDGSAGITFAESSHVSSGSYRTLRNCDTGSIRLRTSSYAHFQEEFTPFGNGTIVAVYSRYNETSQLFIRDIDDLSFINNRCDGHSQPQDPTYISIDSVRKLFTGKEKEMGNHLIRGIVISDIENGNVSYRNVIIQGSNDDKGIILYYNSDVTYNKGDSIEVKIRNTTLTEFNGKLELVGVSKEQTTLLATNKKITPKTVTIGQLLGNRKTFESTLVTISNVYWQAGAPTFGSNTGNLTISDGTATIAHYTDAKSTFKDSFLPPSPVTSITGIVEIYFANVQLRIRFPDDPVNDVIP